MDTEELGFVIRLMRRSGAPIFRGSDGEDDIEYSMLKLVKKK